MYILSTIVLTLLKIERVVGLGSFKFIYRFASNFWCNSLFLQCSVNFLMIKTPLMLEVMLGL